MAKKDLISALPSLPITVFNIYNYSGTVKGQYVFEPLFLVVIAAQCRDHSQCWPVALSLELNRCHERFHFPARHKLTEYVMDPIHPDDLLAVPFYDMEQIYLSVISN